MYRGRVLSVGLVAALTATALAVATPSPTPAVATGGQGWSALGSGTTGGRVFQLVKSSGGTLYAGGSFSSVGGVAHTKGVAQWNPDTSAWSALAGGVTAGDVYALGLDEASTPAQLYVGGNFTDVSNSAGALRAELLAVWDGNSFSAITGATNGAMASWQGVEEIAVVASDKVFIGGGFQGTTNAFGFGMVSGTALAAVNNGLGGSYRFVNGMTPDGTGGVIIGGQFTSVNGAAANANRVARWDGTSWSGFSATPATSGPTADPRFNLVAAVASTSAGVVIGGNFGAVANANDPVSGTKALALWNGTAWQSLGTVVGTVVEELRVIGNYLYVGGEFISIGGVTALNIARYNLSTSTWEAITHRCFNGVNSVVRSIVDTGLGDGSIYVGGGFTSAGGVTGANGVAMYRPSTQRCLDANTGSPVIPTVDTPHNLRVAGLTRDRVAGLNGMRIHLAWETSGFVVQSAVTTRGLVRSSGFDPTVEHADLGCISNEKSCSIFFPFTSNVPGMNGRQYHQVIFTLKTIGFFGTSAPISFGPMTDLGTRLASEPLGVQAEATWRGVTVTWEEPADLGSLGFATAYLVQSNPGGRVCIASVTTFPPQSSTRRCEFRNLVSGTEYTFTVQALTFGGWGATSAPSQRLAPKDLNVTSAVRTRPLLAVPGTTRVRVVGSASGYAQGTPVKAFMQIGTGVWRELRDARVRVDRSGNFTFTREISPLYVRRNVSVRFEVSEPVLCAAAPHPLCGTTDTVVISPLRR